MVMLILAHIVGIVCCLVAILVLNGNTLGVIESIGGTLIVGLSVDYLAHLAAAYLELPADKSRELRTHGAIAHIGGSVVAGAATSFVAAFFLCLGYLVNFRLFGMLIMCLIILSLAFSMATFMCALYLWGPQGRTCSIWRCFPCTRRFDNTGPLSDDDALATEVHLHKFGWKVRTGTAVVCAVILLTGIAVRMGLSLTPMSTDASECPAYDTIDFTFEEYAVPKMKDSYRCRGYDKTPVGCQYYITKVDPIVTDGLIGVVHHMILSSTSKEVSSCPFMCFDMPDVVKLDAGWAVGSDGITYPDGLGQAFGGFPQALQMHYYNFANRSDIIDKRSGIRLHVTTKRPKHVVEGLLIGVHPLGEMRIPGRRNLTVYQAECKPLLTGDFTIVNYAPHAHKLGRRILTEHRRPINASHTKFLSDIGNADPYHFDYQTVTQYAPAEYKILRPGDSIRVTCHFDSTSRTRDTVTGWGSEDEMCMTFLQGFPKENLADPNCLVREAERVS
eukprot:TRINITY_DN24652_c0_g1_i1.p1 TRINITY_DN24652_c0_g1~~TRINITY_DN24652_c0_g1_i1.p1  ORF type:complete len:509 (-),score=36.98 TRINITY_DN24652_c0_g1_i1:90-1595(-)